MMNIYGFGNALIDIEFLITDEDLLEIGIPKGGMKNISSEEKDHFLNQFREKEISRTAGGSIANSLSAAASQGAKSSFSCSIGADTDGEEFLDSINDLEVFSAYSSRSTGVCIVFITPDGERTMASALEANLDLSPKCLSIKSLKNSDVLLLDTFSLGTDSGFNTVKESIKIANINNVEVCYGISDASLISLYFDKISWILSQDISYIYGNKNEVSEFKTAFTLKDEKIITTLGAEGASISIGNIKVNAKAISPVSTNGAGDALVGVFMALKEKNSHQDALQIAVDYATEICKISGPRTKNAT
jgi:sugar/nucleoside kinase (ribokinase family)